MNRGHDFDASLCRQAKGQQRHLGPVRLSLKGGRIYSKLTLRERADAIIAHEYEELLAGGDHAKALKAAAKTKLPILPNSRRLNRAMAR